MERAGYREEAYFSVSHAPAEDDEGRIVGMLAVCSEVTAQVIGERRLNLLRDVGTEAADIHSLEATCQDVAAALVRDPLDVPFALIYLREADDKLCPQAELVAPPVLLESTEWPTLEQQGRAAIHL